MLILDLRPDSYRDMILGKGRENDFFVSDNGNSNPLLLRRTLVHSVPKGSLWDNSIHLKFT